jgi:hypothetical protein
MVIFNSYVKLPEGIPLNIINIPWSLIRHLIKDHLRGSNRFSHRVGITGPGNARHRGCGVFSEGKDTLW